MAKVNQDTKKYKCDECSATFIGKNVKLVKPIKNIEMHPVHSCLIFVDKSGTITGGELKKGDKLLACPKCEKVHLFGFEQRQNA